MKKFLFRFETVLSVRRARESVIRREFEHANQKFNQLKEQEKTLQQQIDSLINEIHLRRMLKKSDLQETYSHILEQLNHSLAQVKQNLLIQEKQIEEQQARLKRAHLERKMIEKIKEKHYAGWRMRKTRSEGALLDDLAALKKYAEPQ
jgi:flagellar export protein FliJ